MRPDKLNFKNRPKHIKADNRYYFFTVRCVEGKWFLKDEKYKKILLDILISKSKKFEYPLIAYVILNNHYHIINRISDADKIPKFVGELNGSSAREINKTENIYDRKIWWNYYDHVIRDEKDFFKHLNYIHQNPIKHRVSNDFDYKFSSYNSWLNKKGKEYLDHAFEKYPIVDFVVINDDF